MCSVNLTLAGHNKTVLNGVLLCAAMVVVPIGPTGQNQKNCQWAKIEFPICPGTGLSLAFST